MKVVHTIILSLLSLQISFGQVTISGTVHDRRGEPLFGVNVYLQGTYDGSSTNHDGFYSFRSEENGVQNIVASCIGYKLFQKEIKLISETSKLSIVLEEEINKIDGNDRSESIFLH